MLHDAHHVRYALGDENGLYPNETTAELPPQRIKEVQAEEARFVKEWMKGKGSPILNHVGLILTANVSFSLFSSPRRMEA